MNSLSLGGYIAELHAAIDRARWRALLLLPGIVALPCLVQSLLHPLDVVKFDFILHGLPMPHTATGQQLTVAVTEVVVIGAAVCMWQLIASIVFYRKAQVFGRAVATPRLWPVPAVLVGGLGNLAWFIGLDGSFDLSYVIGFYPVLVTILIEIFFEGLGRDFVVGTPTGFHPPN
jgi:hypothetical protein